MKSVSRSIQDQPTKQVIKYIENQLNRRARDKIYDEMYSLVRHRISDLVFDPVEDQMLKETR